LIDKRVVVAGSARGIGEGIARRLAAEGAKVILGDIHADQAAAVAKDITASGGTAVSQAFDLHDETSIRNLISKAVEVFGGVDGLVNVAYEARAEYHQRDFEIAEMDPAVWESVLHANLIGTALLTKHALPHLTAAGGGSIVNISSGASSAGEPIRVAYGVSKAGINSMTRHVARTYGDRRIRANCVSPGAVLSEAGQAAFDEDMRQGFLAMSPIKRLGQPSDIAGAVVFLLSDDAEWVTGQVWSVNGGTMMRD
jgi:NAD(P)-dependent dehydrogenase (short-subunit alcohol dehydrogenase family)